MSTTRLIVLANSKKLHDRCLAGIEPDTSNWIRPVTDTGNGAVPLSMMKLDNGKVPELLDVIDLPLDSTGPDFEFESENRTILPGTWRFVKKANVAEIAQFVETPHYILHNAAKYCTLEELQQIPVEQRNTLQLIRVDELHVVDDPYPPKKHKWKGILQSGGKGLLIGITDPKFLEKLNEGHRPSHECFLTMSLSLPFEPENWEGSPPCWKLIAGVIENE